MPKEYKHIEILEETLGMPSKINITYENGTVEDVNDAYECYMHLCAFAKQEGLVTDLGVGDTDKLLSDAEKVSYATKKEEEIAEEEPTKTTEKEETAAEKKEETKEKKSRWNIKRISAWFLAILVGGGIGYGAFQLGKKQGAAGGSKPFVQVVDTQEYDNLPYGEKLVLLNENSGEVIDGLADMVNGKLESSKELDQCIENMANFALANITEISDYVTGRTSSATGSVSEFSFSEPFTKNPVDFCAVDYFNGLRDDVVNAAYTTKSVNETKVCVTKFNEEFVNFVFGGKPLPYNMNGNTVYYTFESLSPSAKMTILAMGITMLNVEHDFSINIDGVEYNRIVAITEAYKLNETIYQELAQTQKFTKTK